VEGAKQASDGKDMGRDDISQFYLGYFNEAWAETLSVPCPFCVDRGYAPGRLTVFLNKESFFHGYFRCHNRCVPGGFPLWFARLAKIRPGDVPGYDPDRERDLQHREYPVENINDEVRAYQGRITEEIYRLFQSGGVRTDVLDEMRVGFNGRYIVYPYVQEDGNCYSSRCVFPDKVEDYFWGGMQEFATEPYNLYNSADLHHAEGGALFICEGEDSMLALRQLGFPGVAVPHHTALEKIGVERLKRINTLFISVSNSHQAANSARAFASRVGYKARILEWDGDVPRDFSLFQLARASGKNFGRKVTALIRNSRAFSPFNAPAYEYRLFENEIRKNESEEYLGLTSGFPLFDGRLGGVHGLNVIGGAPKVGKSTFLIQIASEMALREIPVLYYDFENGRQKIYQRTLSRLSRVETGDFVGKSGDGNLEAAYARVKRMMFFMRVINDRKLSPELMRKHIEFIRYETRSEYTVVVIDSLHKLPFKDFSERRTGIDAWLRQMESIRDTMQVSFLVISELSRGAAGSYSEEPHLGIFKGSGDIEYSADNAMVLFPAQQPSQGGGAEPGRCNRLWLVASRENSPGCLADYRLDYPFWGFTEHAV
jgi:replicative DNA helicase